MPYIGVSPAFGVRRKHTYTATAGQTSFSGAGSEGATLSYTDSNFVDVYQNGVKLGDADYTSTSGTAIVLAQGASVDDLVEIIVFDAFSAADTVSKADGGTFDGAVSFAGDITDSGDLTVDVAGDLTLDVGGGDIILKDDGTEFANIANSSSDLQIVSIVSDKDIIFRGNDGGSFLNALTLDMSDAGTAIFNHDIKIADNNNIQFGAGADLILSSDGTNGTIANLTSNGDLIFQGNDGGSTITALTFDMSNSGDAFFNGDVYLAQYVVHKDDTDTFMQFGDNSTSFTQGNVERFEMNKTAGVVRIKPGGSNVIYFDGNGQSINNESRRARLDMSSNTAAYSHINCQNTGTGNGVFIAVLNSSGTVIGSISQSGTSTLFNTSSDYRIKENVNYNFDATTELKKLKPCKFNFIGESETIEGFLAHEVSDVVPRAVNGAKDETRDIGTIKDADGNVLQENAIEARKEDGQTWEKTGTENVIQGLDQAKLVPLLVKTIQELEARITALENAE